MNLWQRLIHRLFGTQYVVLEKSGGSFIVRRAYQLGGIWYAHDVYPDARVRLLSAGKTTPTHVIKGWHAVTSGVKPTNIIPYEGPRVVRRRAEAR